MDRLVQTIDAIKDDAAIAGFTFRTTTTWKESGTSTSEISSFTHMGQETAHAATEVPAVPVARLPTSSRRPTRTSRSCVRSTARSGSGTRFTESRDDGRSPTSRGCDVADARQPDSAVERGPLGPPLSVPWGPEGCGKVWMACWGWERS